LYDFDCWLYQSAVTYVFIGSMTALLYGYINRLRTYILIGRMTSLLYGYGKIFPKQTRFLSLIEFYLFRKKPDHLKSEKTRPSEKTSASGFNLLCFGSLMLFFSFFMLQTHFDFRFLRFFRPVKFGHQHMTPAF
jgi:hypothetical protein